MKPGDDVDDCEDSFKYRSSHGSTVDKPRTVEQLKTERCGNDHIRYLQYFMIAIS